MQDDPRASFSDVHSEAIQVFVERAQAELAAAERANQGLPPRLENGQTAAARWAGFAHTMVRRAGHNRGAARDSIIQLFAAEECALSVPEVEARLQSKRPVGRASMYRAIEVLHGLGLITRVDVGDGVSRYERAHLDHDDHHHHMVCGRCGLLTAFDDEALESAIQDVGNRLGYAVTAHEVVLRGTCPECQ